MVKVVLVHLVNNTEIKLIDTSVLLCKYKSISRPGFVPWTSSYESRNGRDERDWLIESLVCSAKVQLQCSCRPLQFNLQTSDLSSFLLHELLLVSMKTSSVFLSVNVPCRDLALEGAGSQLR